MTVLKIIAWIFLGLLVSVILALCVKVRLYIEYSEVDTHILLKFLFIKIPLFPSDKKGAKKKEEETQQTGEEKKAEKPTEKKQGLLHDIYSSEGIDGLLLIVRRIFSYLRTFFGGLLRAFVIEECYIDVGCTRGDAASTAIYYGEVCSALFPMLGSIAAKCRLKKYNINVYPDYLAKHSRSAFYVSLYVRPICLAGVALALVFKLLFNVLMRLMVKTLKTKNKKAKNTAAVTERPAA